MKKLLVAMVAFGLVASSLVAGEAKNVYIKSEVQNANNKAQGANTVAVQNVHSVDVGHGGTAKNVTIKGNVRNVNNKAQGYRAVSKQNVGSVRVK